MYLKYPKCFQAGLQTVTKYSHLRPFLETMDFMQEAMLQLIFSYFCVYPRFSLILLVPKGFTNVVLMLFAHLFDNRKF